MFLILLVILLFMVSGGWYGHHAGYYGEGGLNLVAVLAVILLIYMFVGHTGLWHSGHP
jgi:hypothetical protein